jgi:hypothetical protein
MENKVIKLSELKPISEGDRWGFYDGRMPLYLAYIQYPCYGINDTVMENRIYPAVIWYDVVNQSWRSQMSFYEEEEILGIIAIPKLEIE